MAQTNGLCRAGTQAPRHLAKTAPPAAHRANCGSTLRQSGKPGEYAGDFGKGQT